MHHNFHCSTENLLGAAEDLGQEGSSKMKEVEVAGDGGSKKKLRTASAKPNIPQGGSKALEQNSAKDEQEKIESSGKSASTSKNARQPGGASKKEKQPVQKCVENCKAGKNSGCPIKARGRGKASNNVGCADIDRMLEAMGVDAKNASLCVKAAIMKGHIKITGKEGDLEKVVHKEEGMCGHMIEATLGDLLKQPDYAGFDYEMGLENVTVVCKVKSFYCFRVVSEDGKNIKEI